MKNKKISLLASAVATCAVCGSIIAGSTYALFTSESNVDVTISTGKVAVETTVTANLVRPNDLGNEEAGITKTELSAENGELALENILPGDTVEFTVTLENKGTVDAKYRYSLDTLSGWTLMSAFDVTIGDWENSQTGIISYKSAVDTIKAGATVNYNITLALDSEVGNEYEGLETKLSVSTYAVQYNAPFTGNEEVEKIPDGLKVIEVRNAAELTAALPIKNAYIRVIEDIDAAATTFKVVNDSNMVIDLNGHTVSAKYIQYQAYNVKAGAGMNCTVKNGTLKVSGIYEQGDTSLVTFENVHIFTVGAQAIYVQYGDDAVINSGTYEGDLVYGGPVNFFVDIENKTLSAGGNVYTFDSMQWVYEPTLGGVLLQVGDMIDGIEGKIIYIESIDEVTENKADQVYVDKSTGYLIGLGKYGWQYGVANRFLFNVYDTYNCNSGKTEEEQSLITVYGGTFKNFNPANNVAETIASKIPNGYGGTKNSTNGKATNFVAEGYTVVYIQDAHGDFWFTVIPEEEVASYEAKGYTLAGTEEEDVALYIKYMDRK